MRIVPLTLLAASLVGSIAGVGSQFAGIPSFLLPSYGEVVGMCRVTDGDTMRCQNERIRLLGIDAPELPGHCRVGRECAAGDPYRSTASLKSAMSDHLRIARVGVDKYGRTLAIVAGEHGDLACWQLVHHQAIYKREWDTGLRVARMCPTSALEKPKPAFDAGDIEDRRPVSNLTD